MGIFGHPGHIVNNAYAVFFCEGPQFFQVLNTDGLSARHIHTGGNTDIRDSGGTMFFNQGFQFFQVHISFKGKFIFGVMGFVNDDVFEFTTGQFLVQAGGGEIHIARDNISFFNQDFGDDIFRAASLVCGN